MAEEMVGYVRVIRGDLPARGRPVTQMILPLGAMGDRPASTIKS